MRGGRGMSCASAGVLCGGDDCSAGGFVRGKRGSARFVNAGDSVCPASSGKDSGVSTLIRSGALTGALRTVAGKAGDRTVVIKRKFGL